MNLALNPFDRGKKPEYIDEIVVDETVRKAVDKFNKVLPKFIKLNTKDMEVSYKMFKRYKWPVLTPNEIYVVHNLIPATYYSGPFMSILVGNSFNEGYNDFFLENSSDYVGMFLIGKEDNRLRLNVEGDCGQGFGLKARYCDFTINGNSGWDLGAQAKDCSFKARDVDDKCGTDTERCSFEVNNSGHCCGQYSEHSTFKINGNCGKNLGQYASDCEFTVKGDTGESCGFLGYDNQFWLHGKVGPWAAVNVKEGNIYYLNKKEYERMKDFDGLDVRVME